MSSTLFSGLLKLLRPRQWTKGAVCLAGAFFGGHLFEAHFVFRALLAAVAFCAASSFVYIINDVVDVDFDRNHPLKKFRPIASGAVSIPQALSLSVFTGAVAVLLGAYLGPVVLGILTFYCLINVSYSVVLKNLSLVDATVVATGFILRIYAGTVAVGVSPSAWIILCTFFLALFLAFGKRRAEIKATAGQQVSSPPVLEKYPVAGVGSSSQVRELDAPIVEAVATRAVLHKYNVAILDRFCNICATLTIATYALFTVLGHPNHTLIITTPPVVMGIFRYLLLVERYQDGEAPEAILTRDWAIQLAIFIWIFLYVAVLYFGLHIDVQ